MHTKVTLSTHSLNDNIHSKTIFEQICNTFMYIFSLNVFQIEMENN